MWDLGEMGKKTEVIPGHDDWVRSVAMNEDGSRGVSGSYDETVRGWDVESGRQVGKAMVGHSRYINCLTLSVNGRYAVSGSEDNTVWAWDVERGTEHECGVECSDERGWTAGGV